MNQSKHVWNILVILHSSLNNHIFSEKMGFNFGLWTQKNQTRWGRFESRLDRTGPGGKSSSPSGVRWGSSHHVIPTREGGVDCGGGGGGGGGGGCFAPVVIPWEIIRRRDPDLPVRGGSGVSERQVPEVCPFLWERNPGVTTAEGGAGIEGMYLDSSGKLFVNVVYCRVDPV